MKGEKPHPLFRFMSTTNEGRFNQVSAPVGSVLLEKKNNENSVKKLAPFQGILCVAERALDFV
jgi:hypothetical protein